jgi:hypothetical protein
MCASTTRHRRRPRELTPRCPLLLQDLASNVAFLCLCVRLRPVGDSVFSCDFGEHPVTTDNGQHFTEPDACDDLDDLTAMILPLNAECCDEPEEDCTLGYPLTCNEGCAAVLLPFKRACDPLFNSDAAGIELRQIGGIINRAAASCPADGGAASCPAVSLQPCVASRFSMHL